MNPVRARLAELMQATVRDEERNWTWTYRAVRPMRVPSSWQPGQRVIGDCSKGVQYLYRWAGGPDPMGNNWASWGNSSTLWSNLTHADFPAQLRVGDIITFGPNGDEHAVCVAEPGHDPLLWSFGHQGAPNFYRLSRERRQYQLRFSDLPDDGPSRPPTPQEKLRAKTGWFAWVAWKRGEGDWRKYGKANRKVRPAVPQRIPLGWWRRYVVFLRNRKKANG